MHHAAGVGALWACQLLLAVGHANNFLNNNLQSPVDVAGGSKAEVPPLPRRRVAPLAPNL